MLFTDYDPGSLKLIDENIQLNNNNNNNVSCFSHFLEWGSNTSDIINSLSDYHINSFNLIVGTDLIYSIDVVNPLFCTAKDLLNNCDGKFLLVTSFMLNEVSIIIISLLFLL